MSLRLPRETLRQILNSRLPLPAPRAVRSPKRAPALARRSLPCPSGRTSERANGSESQSWFAVEVRFSSSFYRKRAGLNGGRGYLTGIGGAPSGSTCHWIWERYWRVPTFESLEV
jgi:hypothetical protein